jgi:CRISPR-associated RAMP protein (TIGR02581 family)
MLKQLVNEAQLTLRIEATGPLLVKSGHATITGPDMTPVLTFRNGQREVYLPGSSLKGVLRSHLEKIGRTLGNNVVCNPFARAQDHARLEQGQPVCPAYHEVACSDKFELREKGEITINSRKWQLGSGGKEKLSNQQVYAESCPICRLFGSTFYIGRVSIGDAYLVQGSQARPTEVRDGVGIDRLTGGAANRAKFELEVVASETVFETKILLRNFEIWQLGMLLLVAQDMADELIRVGSGRSRGLGAVRGQLDALTIAHIGRGPEGGAVWGLGKFLADKPARYGTQDDDMVKIDPAPATSRRGIRFVGQFAGPSLDALRQASIDALMARLKIWQIPEAMTFAHLQLAPAKVSHG